MLKSELDKNGKEIKSHNNGFTRYYKAYDTWTSGLTSFSTSEMYMINTSAPITVDFEGEFVEYENRQIDLVEGWNWIGYPVNEEFERVIDVKPVCRLISKIALIKQIEKEEYNKELISI